jgi:hypothetical protein
MRKLIRSVLSSIINCRIHILTIFITYCLTCCIGIIMVHNGNNFALSYRDKIVGKALSTSKTSINYQRGNNFSAAITDFAGNLFFGAVPQTLMGIGIIVPYFTVSKQGWVGGIVSVNSEHESRFKNIRSTLYYFFVLLLQFMPYSLAIGAGIKFGIDFYNYNKIQGWSLWKYKIQKTWLKDLGYVYLLVIPLFFIASCFEFLSAWNV